MFVRRRHKRTGESGQSEYCEEHETMKIKLIRIEAENIIILVLLTLIFAKVI